ncbi:preprotein translocase subunit YajC [Zavarzinia sp. CC-PAN008]|uniref:preprotein translocase subunit YajC n=1 Tax=Zavarzinia sp. CC-PAN008 TaxID=3243332 RepID=UPI003F746950
MLISSAYAQAAGGAPGGSDFLIQLLPLVLIFVVFYFLLIRPQQKRVKEHRALVEGVRRGDVVVTSGGIVGKIAKVEEGEVLVEIAEGVRIRVVKATLSEVRSRTQPAGAADEPPAESKTIPPKKR